MPSPAPGSQSSVLIIVVLQGFLLKSAAAQTVKGEFSRGEPANGYRVTYWDLNSHK